GRRHSSTFHLRPKALARTGILLACVIGALWVFWASERAGSNSPPRPPSFTARPLRPSASSVAVDRDLARSSAPHAPVISEEKPSVGTTNLLTREQIRYCLSEGIRIDGARPLVDEHATVEVRWFNEAVSDYNSRCGRFR